MLLKGGQREGKKNTEWWYKQKTNSNMTPINQNISNYI